MINKNYLKLIRSNHRFEENNFIYQIIAKRIVDSIDLLNLEVKNILELGINDNIIYNHVRNKFIIADTYRSDINLTKSILTKKNRYISLDIDRFKLKENFFNLIFSNCFIHQTNNIEKILKQVLLSLNSNGFFIATIPDSQSMYQLLNSMYETDNIIYNGAYRRVNPTISIDNILSILKKLNFDAPCIHSDRISINYENFNKLLKDVKGMNLTYCHKDKKQNFENKKYFKTMEKIYNKNYFHNGYIMEVKINIVSAWKK